MSNNNIFLQKKKKENAHNKEVHCLNWSPDNEKLVTASADESVKVI